MNDTSALVKNHRLYADFKKVSDKLAEKQFVCWLAGGAVRDFLMGRAVVEFDLVTDASTENLKILFPNAVLVGEQFGVIKLPTEDGGFFDLATFREEADYKDGRRPSLVQSSTPIKDHLRRDFTINSMFWSENNGVVDYGHGVVDLKSRQLICVGDAEIRFTEDYLRILRLVRFAANFGFEIEVKTQLAAEKQLPSLKKMSAERLWSEFKKIDSVDSWKRFLQNDLSLKILKLIFADSTNDIRKLRIEKFDTFLMLNLIYNDDLSVILKKDLKVSNIELKKYESIRRVKVESAQLSVEELCYELEKNESYKWAFDLLVDAGLIAKELRTKVIELQKRYPAPLVQATDLLNLVPNSEIGKELRLIRLSQLGDFYKNTEQVLDALSKKYANK